MAPAPLHYCAYLPTNVDNLPAKQKTTVTEQHMELHAHLTTFPFSLLGMDANETIHPLGSIHIRHSELPTGLPITTKTPHLPSKSCEKNTLGTSSMTCYQTNMLFHPPPPTSPGPFPSVRLPLSSP